MKLGFIGVGNMGEAILRGALRGGVVQAEDVLAFDVSRESWSGSAMSCALLPARARRS